MTQEHQELTHFIKELLSINLVIVETKLLHPKLYQSETHRLSMDTEIEVNGISLIYLKKKVTSPALGTICFSLM